MTDTPETLYTIREIAEQLKLPESTGRYYKDQYGEFLPSVKTVGMQYPKYKAPAIKIMQVIRELAELGKTQEEIKKELSSRGYKVEFSGVAVIETPKKLDPQISQLIAAIKTIAPDQAELERLRKENRILKGLYIQEKITHKNTLKLLAAPPKKSLFQRLKFW